MEARQDNSGVLCADVAFGRLDVAIAFEPEELAGTMCEEIAREPAVLAVAVEHPRAGQERVTLAELAGERFALVDAAGGPGYNRVIVEWCRAEGFEPALDGDPHGPMAWETAVRTRGAVGLTTRSSAVSTARGIALIDLHPRLEFAIKLVTSSAGPQPPAVMLAGQIASGEGAARGAGPGGL